MGYRAQIIRDSISPTGKRLTTMEASFPRSALAEFNTHRDFSRNSASSRAIPVATMIRRVLDDTFFPSYVGRNGPGMQASAYLEEAELDWVAYRIERGRDEAVAMALELILGPTEYAKHFPYHPDKAELEAEIDHVLGEYQAYIKDCRERGVPQTRYLDVHKQTANRYLEPYLFHTVIVTATEWSNFFALRASDQADPMIRVIAELMREAMAGSMPQLLGYGEWHLPYLQADEEDAASADPTFWAGVCSGRCAHVSYLTHDRRRSTDDDRRLFEGLATDGHMSPMEHIARPLAPRDGQEVRSGNLLGWHQFRKDFENEHDFSLVTAVR